MAATPALPGLFCCITALILLIFATISTPIWNDIFFLEVTANGATTRFGAFGYTGSPKQVGYYIDSAALGFTYVLPLLSFPFSRPTRPTRPSPQHAHISPSVDGLNTTTVHNLTATMILHPIAAAFALFAAIFGFCGAGYSRIGTLLMSLCAALATLVTLIIWIIDMSFWGVVRNRIRDSGVQAQYGNANCESPTRLL